MPTKKKVVATPPAEEFDTELSLLGRGAETFVKIAWPPGEVTKVADFLVTLATGAAFGVFMQFAQEYAINNEMEEDFGEIERLIAEEIAKHKHILEADEDELVVEPFQAMRRLGEMGGGSQHE